ncbi:helix-turn-helix domain-containing protein [Pseudonocardia sp. CA-142604]|uniref:helix-turn-helix domain-containing protein n=1 Tax=Pseudonocardia sp. CA-142604 TaxID=3240024 RepID=UPI003D918B30
MTVVELRYRAVLAVERGERKVDVAAQFGVSRQSVHSWCARYAAHPARRLDRVPGPEHTLNQRSAGRHVGLAEPEAVALGHRDGGRLVGRLKGHRRSPRGRPSHIRGRKITRPLFLVERQDHASRKTLLLQSPSDRVSPAISWDRATIDARQT